MSQEPGLHRRAAMSAILSAPLLSCGGARRRSEHPQVRLAVTRGSFLFLPVYVAGPLGYFEAEQVNLQLEESASVSKSTQSLLGGSCEIAAASLLRPLMLAADGQQVKAFVTTQNQPGFVAAVSPRASRPIRRIEDLKGANVGTSTIGSDFHLMLNCILVAHGLSPRDVQVISVGTAAAHAAALERGMVDVGLIAGTTIPVMEKRYPGMTYLFDTRTAEGTRAQLGVGELPTGTLFARTDWLNRNADTARKVTRAVRRATEWMRTHSPADIREKLPESCRTEREADLEAIRFSIPMLSQDGRFRPETVQAVWKILLTANQKTTAATIDLETTYTNQFLDL